MSAGESAAGEVKRRIHAGPFGLTDWSQPPGARLGWHSHASPSLSLTLHGHYREIYRGRSVECRAGDVVVKPAGEGHRDQMADDGARTLLVELSEPAAAGLGEAWRRLDEPVVRAGAALQSLVWRCEEELRREDAWSPLALESLALELVVFVARRPGRREPRAAPSWLARGVEFLRESHEGEVRVAEVARACGVHPAHLARVFRRHLGCSVGEMLRELRLSAAIEELSRGGSSVADVARRAGFYDHSHLARVLKKRLGLTPGELRAAVRRRAG